MLATAEGLKFMAEVIRTPDVVRSFLTKIGRIPVLSASNELVVAKKVFTYYQINKLLENGNEKGLEESEIWCGIADHFGTSVENAKVLHESGRKARETMINANLRLVVYIAKKYQNRNMELIDLIQEGAIGLERAVEKFNPFKGYKFSTYAYWWIRQAITRALDEKSRFIRLPIHMREKINRVKEKQKELVQQLGRTPTQIELALEMDMNPEYLRFLLESACTTTSLDMPVGEDGNTLMDLISQEEGGSDALEEDELRAVIQAALSNLTSQEREVVILRFGIDDGTSLSLAEIGRRLELSRERIRQIERKALERLRGNRFIADLRS
jgi:RNA polymerase nonessential primary-like sigma factor